MHYVVHVAILQSKLRREILCRSFQHDNANMAFCKSSSNGLVRVSAFRHLVLWRGASGTRISIGRGQEPAFMGSWKLNSKPFAKRHDMRLFTVRFVCSCGVT